MRQRGEFFFESLHTFILCNFAITQPLFDLLSRNAEFFIIRRSEPVDIFLLVVLLCVAFPAVLVVFEGGAGLIHRRLREGIHRLVVASLVAGIAAPLVKQVGGLPGPALLLVAALLGLVTAGAYTRLAVVRLFITALSPALLLFPGLFLFNSPISKVVFAKNVGEATPTKIVGTTPVVFVIFDEFSLTALLDEHHQIDPIRYPHFAAFAQQATWFRNTTTVSNATIHAVPAILTGKYPDYDRLPMAADHPHNLFTLLGASHDIQVFGTATQLCPNWLCYRETKRLTQRMRSLLSDLGIVYLHILLPADLSTRLPAVTQNWTNFLNAPPPDNTTTARESFIGRLLTSAIEDLQGDRIGQFTHFVKAISVTERPTLSFLHILLPHAPYHYLPSGQSYSTDGGLTGSTVEKWGNDEWAVTQSYQRYLLQVGCVDTLLGNLLDHLKAVDLYDPALLVVTADHGVSFRPNDFRRPLTKTNFHDLMPVPLFIKAPHQHAGVLNEQQIETIDILPTIADILGIRLPWPVDGHSAFAPSVPERDTKVVFFEERQNLRIAPAALEDAITVAVKQKLALFGPEAQSDRLFTIDASHELVGRPIQEIDRGKEIDATIGLDHSQRFADLNPRANFVPAQITGTFLPNGDVSPSSYLAVAINGTIRAVTRSWTFPIEGVVGKWSAIVDQQSFRAGRNDVEVFIVSTSQGKSILHRPAKLTR
jgi:Sulfatase